MYSSMVHVQLQKYLLASINIFFTRLKKLRSLTLSPQDIDSGPYMLFPSDKVTMKLYL